MGLLNSALQIGRSALLSYQGALQVVGNNISSAATPGYTRLSPQLDPLQGMPIAGDLQPGAGVALSAIQRNIDESLESRIRLAIGDETAATARGGALVRMESFFDDLNRTGVGTRLDEFFAAFDELLNAPEDIAIRDLTVSAGEALSGSIQNLRSQLTALGDDVDGQIGSLAVSADALARQIARLNREITEVEAGRPAQATGLRDQRDGLLRQLSEIFDVTVREQADGTINIYIGGETLVQGSSVRGLIASEELDGEQTRTSIRFADTNQQVQVRAGTLAGLLSVRDQDSRIAMLDQLAEAIIFEVNRIHADGQGSSGFRSVIGAADVFDPDASLDSAAAGLVQTPDNGSFYITVVNDATQTPVAHRIDVSLDGTSQGTTLASLAADISAQVDGVTASVTNDNRLRLDADAGVSFVFGFDGQDARPDTSGVLAALGINTFFSGSDARSMAVNETLKAQPSLLASASVFLPGDGTIAGRIAQLSSLASGKLDAASIPEFYRRMTNGAAVATAAARDDVDAASSILISLQTQRESISGVNLDEEAIQLIKFQRAFQGTARFIRVVDDLLTELIALVR